MKRIGLMISTMNSGGAERVVAHLSHILSEKYDVHVILFESTIVEYECAGTMHSLNIPARNGGLLSKINLLFRRIKELKKLIKRENLSCVISFLDSPNFVNLFAKVKGCRKIVSIRNFSSLENRLSLLGRLTDVFMQRVYKRADCVVTVSKLIEEDFKTSYHIPSNKITAIYNPYDFDDILQKGIIPLSEEERDFYNGRFVFANVARIMYQKGVWHLVKAFSIVHSKHTNTRLVLVGEDFSYGKLQRLIDELDLKDNILLTGRTRNPYKYIQNADCYVLTSLFEGFPNAMVEAMVCGCPIIAADCKSGPREILCKEPDLKVEIKETMRSDYGILIPALDEEENWDASVISDCQRKLAEAMINIIVNEEERKALADAAKERSRDFDYGACCKAFTDVIEIYK